MKRLELRIQVVIDDSDPDGSDYINEFVHVNIDMETMWVEVTQGNRTLVTGTIPIVNDSLSEAMMVAVFNRINEFIGKPIILTELEAKLKYM